MADFTGSFSGSFTGSYDILTHSDEYNGTTYGYVLHQRVGTGKAEKILLSDFFRDWLGSESGSAGIQNYGAYGHIFDGDRILIRSGSYSGSSFRPILKTATISNLFGGYSNGTLRNTFIYARGVGRNTEASPTISSSMVLTVGGQILYEDNDGVGDLHGLTLTILEATDFSKVSTTRYNTALGGATAAADSLATAIDDMSPTEIGIITSLGHWETYLSNNLRTAAKKVGLSKLGGYVSTDSGSAYAAVFYGTSGSAGVSDSLERLVAYRFTTGSNLDIPTATITTRVQSNTHGIYPFVNISDASSTNALYRYSANTASVTEPALLVNSDGEIESLGDVVTFKSDTATITLDMSSSSDTFLFVDGYVSTSGHIVPSATELYDLGSTDLRWRDLYLSGSTIYLGNAQISSVGQYVSASFTGSFKGDGSQLTNLPGGGGATPGGVNTEIQYNDGGTLNGATDFVWDAGNVGIGTASPGGNLHILGTTNATAIIEATANNDATLKLLEVGAGDVGAAFVYDGGDNKLYIQAGNNPPVTRMTIQRDNGRVGIGTASPGELLHLSASGDANIRLENNGNGNTSAIEFFRERFNGPAARGAWIGIESDTGTNNTELYIDTSTLVGAPGDTTLGTNNGRIVVRGSSSPSVSLYTGLAGPEVRLTTTGLGINNTNPSYRLDISGSGTNNQQLFRARSTSGDRAILSTDANDDAYLDLYDSSGTIKTRFRTDGNDSYIAGGGNVGIGTTDPQSKLQVDSDTPLVLYGSANDIRLNFDLPNFAYATINARNKADSSNRDLTLQTDGGNVGIGYTTPKTKLHVKGGIAPTSVPAAGATPAESASLYLTNSDPAYGIVMGVLNVGDGYIQAQRTDGTATTYDLLLNPNGGNVGIGTASPQESLHVQGTNDTAIRIASTNSTATLKLVAPIPSIELTDTSTSATDAVITQNSNVLTIYNNGSGLAIDSAGEVGIGTTDPTTKLQITGNTLTGFLSRTNATLTLENTSSTELYLASNTTGIGQLRFGDTDSNFRGAISYLHTDDSMLFYTAGTTRMTISGTGNLFVSADTDSYADIGRTRIGYSAYSDHANFSHVDRTGTGQYAVLQAANGTTYLNAPSGQSIRFRINNSEEGLWNSTGLRIGDETAPSYTLDVNGTFRTTGAGRFDSNLTASYFGVGDGNDGYFYSDANGRTAFRNGDFYIRSEVSNYYNYATNQYIGNTSGDNIYFRGNTLTGDSWTMTGAGISTFAEVNTSRIDTGNGTEIVLNAGESATYATGQTAERIYLNAEAGVEIVSSPDNWGTGWAGRDDSIVLDNGDITLVAGNAFYTNGSNGIRSVTGQYGTIQTTGTTGGYHGINLAGEYVFMFATTNNIGGIYNDTDNQWHLQTTEGAGLRLYYGGSEKLETVTGGVDITGTLDATVDVTVASDIRLKNELPDTVQGLEAVDKIRPIKYTLKSDEDENPKIHLGFSAQELLDIVPEVVRQGDDDYYSVAYQKLVPVLVKAIQELTEEVRELKKKVEE